MRSEPDGRSGMLGVKIMQQGFDAMARRAALLAGLGVTELSMTPRDIPSVKARIRASTMTELQALAANALAAHT